MIFMLSSLYAWKDYIVSREIICVSKDYAVLSEANSVSKGNLMCPETILCLRRWICVSKDYVGYLWLFLVIFWFYNPISMDRLYINLRSFSLCLSFNVLISRIADIWFTVISSKWLSFVCEQMFPHIFIGRLSNIAWKLQEKPYKFFFCLGSVRI